MIQKRICLEDIKLDKIDRKILSHLIQDNRYSKKKLSSQLKVSLPMLNYRIKRLEKDLIQPSISINYPEINFPSFILFIEKLSDIEANSIKESNEVYAMYKLLGKYEYVVNMATEDINGFLNKYLPDKLIEIYPIISQIKDNFNPFNFNLPREKIIPNPKKIIPLDKYDKNILYELCINPSLSNFEISKKTKINWETVKKKVNLLINKGVIQKFGNIINISKYNFQFYVLNIRCTPISILKIIEAANRDIYGGYIYKTNNRIIMHYIPPNQYALSKFISTINNIDKNSEIEVFQNDGNFYVNLTPKSFLNYLKS